MDRAPASPHCSRIELAALPESRDEKRLLHAMVSRPQISTWGAKMQSRPSGRLGQTKADWLHEAAHVMTKAVLKDWEEWKKRREDQKQKLEI